MKQNRICPVCGEDCRRVALVALVYTFEPVDEELAETTWHKNCFVSAQQQARQADAPSSLLIQGGVGTLE